MNKTNDTIELAEKYCREKGERLTSKRKIILTALLNTEKAISAYELVDYCKQHLNETIPVMSVYRILDFLEGQGLAHRLGLANKYVACSHIICSHEHELSQFLICDQCQRVEEININPSILKGLQASVEKNGFQLTNPQLEISGVCDKCVTKENSQARPKK